MQWIKQLIIFWIATRCILKICSILRIQNLKYVSPPTVIVFAKGEMSVSPFWISKLGRNCILTCNATSAWKKENLSLCFQFAFTRHLAFHFEIFFAQFEHTCYWMYCISIVHIMQPFTFESAAWKSVISVPRLVPNLLRISLCQESYFIFTLDCTLA